MAGAICAALAVYVLARALRAAGPDLARAAHTITGEDERASPPAELGAPTAPFASGTPARAELAPGSALAAPAAAPPAGERSEVSAARATLRGLVLDARTGEPVPALEVYWASGGRSEVDGAGRFDVPEGSAPGALELTFRDPLADAEVFEDTALRGARDGAFSFHVLVGPTYTFALVGAPSGLPREGLARVVETDARGREVDWPWLAVRTADGLHRLRYPGEPAERTGIPARIEVLFADEDALVWASGASAIASTRGIHPGPLAIELEACFGLAGRAVDPLGAPLERIRVSALRLDAAAARPERETWSGDTDAAGRFAAFPLAAGRYRVVALSRAHVPAEAVCELAAGPVELGDLVLEPLLPGGDLTGSVAIRGSFEDHVALVRVESRGAFTYDRVVFLELPASAGGTGAPVEFAMRDLPLGEYEVTLAVVPGMPVEPASLRARPPASGLHFEVDASVEGARVGFRVADASSGEPIGHFGALFELGDQLLPTMRRCTYGEPAWKLAASGRLNWWIEAAGYRPAHGDERAFAPAGPGEPRLADVRLTPGYGATFLFRDASPLYDTYFEDADQDELAIFSAPPVAGVRVVADGAVVAQSDERGLAVVALEREPARIELQHAHLRVVKSAGFANGRVAPLRSPTVVWLLP